MALGAPRTLRFLLLLTSSVPLLVGCEVEPAPNTRPNILLVALDDFGFNDLAENNLSSSPTPALDSLARSGLRFTRHYTESTCTPSRAALLTGMYAARVGAHPTLRGIDPGLQTLPEALRDAGYGTFMVGKWHAGDSHAEARPERHGFDHWFGFMNQIYLRGPHSEGGYTRGQPTYLDPWLEDEAGNLQQHEGHLTDLLTDHALSLMESERDPWFIYLAYYAPHTPIEPSEEYARKFSDDDAGRYQALKAQLDDNLARIFDFLDRRGERDDTLIIVVSDNGGTELSWPSNHPYVGVKRTYLEGGVRTPLIISWRNRWPLPWVVDEPVAIFDLYPTILAALGIEPVDDLDGRDIFAKHQPRNLKWYSNSPLGDYYSVLSEDGFWRFTTSLGMRESLIHEDEFENPFPTNHVTSEPQISDDLGSEVRTFIRQSTRVDRLQRIEMPPLRSYSGDDFRRTPLSGNLTLGFALKRGTGTDLDSQEEPLVFQSGYIDIRVASGVLTVGVDGNVAAVEAPESECFTVVIDTRMVKNNAIIATGSGESSQQIYLDGELATISNYRNPELSQSSPSAPLEVRTASDGDWYVPGEAIFLSTRMMSPAEVSLDVHSELARACDTIGERG